MSTRAEEERVDVGERTGMAAVAADVREAVAQVYRPARPGEPDTWVVSFPKSGVTWFRYMVALAISELTGTSPEATVDVGSLTARAGLPPIKWSHNGGSLVFENGDRMPEGALFLVPRVLGFQRRRVLLLVRDPRDVTVSNYHQVSRRSLVPLDVGSLDDFYLHPRRGLRRTVWYHHRWERSKRLTRELHVVRYESLRCGDGAALAAALSFLLQREVPRPVAESVLERSAPATMRDQERRGAIAGMRSFGSDRDDLKVRRAVVGGYADELSPAAVARGDEILRRYGYPFGYCP